MKISYDKEVDAKYISITEGVVHETKVLKDWLMLDLDAKGDILGIEILDASKNLVSITTEEGKLQEIAEIRTYIPDSLPEIGNVGGLERLNLISGGVVV